MFLKLCLSTVKAVIVVMPCKDKICGKIKRVLYNNGNLKQIGSDCVNIYCFDWKSGAVLYLKYPYLLQILGVICVCVCACAHARMPFECVLLFHTFCSLTTGPKPLPKHILHRVRSSAS